MWSDTDLGPPLAIGVTIALLCVGGLIIWTVADPPKYRLDDAGVVAIVQPTGEGRTVIATRERRYEVAGVWPGTPGSRVALRSQVGGAGSKAPFRFMGYRPIVEICRADGSDCAAILN